MEISDEALRAAIDALETIAAADAGYAKGLAGNLELPPGSPEDLEVACYQRIAVLTRKHAEEFRQALRNREATHRAIKGYVLMGV